MSTFRVVFETALNQTNPGSIILLVRGEGESGVIVGSLAFANHTEMCQRFIHAGVAMGDPGELQAWPKQNFEYYLDAEQLRKLGIHVEA